MDHAEVEQVFVDLSIAAGAVILDAFNAPEIETMWKSDGTPVTAADIAADNLIVAGLRRAFPGIPVVSEENPDSHLDSADRLFLVDPLDGTSGFRRHRKNFTVNIALVDHGVPVHGVVYGPALGRHFCTTAGGPVVERKINPETGTVTGTIEFETQPRNNHGLRVVASSTQGLGGKVGVLLSTLDIGEVDTMSSSIKFCLIAASEADIYPRSGPTMEWDTAAGHAILRAVGGQVHEFGSSRILAYGKPKFENPGFVACGPGIRI